MQKVLKSAVSVRFPDCDPFNHLNNARYIDYFMNAREDHLWNEMKFSPYVYAQQHGLSWVVGTNQIAYIKPALLMETVIVQSALLNLREKDILVEMTMWNKEETQLKSLLWVRFVHFNLKTMRSEIHAESLIKQFLPFEMPLDPSITFEQRIEALRNVSSSTIY